MTEDIAALRAHLQDLTARVEALEHRSDAPEFAPDTPDAETFWALEGLRTRQGAHPATASGTVMLVGSLTLPDGAPVAWQEATGTAGLLESVWSERAAAFAALGHPVRLELLRHILNGIHTTAELAELDDLGTTGQLHHHLRQLISAGWVRQTGRGSYEVPATRVVPLLTGLLGAER